MMFSVKVLAVFLTVVFVESSAAVIGDSVKSHKKHQNVDGRIQYGTDTPATWARYMVYLKTRNSYLEQRECGGTLITRRDILTARYCLLNVRSISVYIGLREKNNPSNDTILLSLDGSNVFVHDELDMGLIRLPAGSVTDEQLIRLNIQPIPLSRTETEQNHSARIYGWGASKTPPFVVNNLQYLDVNISYCYECYTKFMCTTGYKKACFGDTGGPLVVNDTLSGEVQIGVIVWSEGLMYCYGNLPTYYIPVNQYLGWIKDHTIGLED